MSLIHVRLERKYSAFSRNSDALVLFSSRGLNFCKPHPLRVAGSQPHFPGTHFSWQSTVQRLQNTVDARKKYKKKMDDAEEDTLDTLVFRGMRKETQDADEVRLSNLTT